MNVFEKELLRQKEEKLNKQQEKIDKRLRYEAFSDRITELLGLNPSEEYHFYKNPLPAYYIWSDHINARMSKPMWNVCCYSFWGVKYFKDHEDEWPLFFKRLERLLYKSRINNEPSPF